MDVKIFFDRVHHLLNSQDIVQRVVITNEATLLSTN